MLKKRNFVPELTRLDANELTVKYLANEAPTTISNCQVISTLDQPSRDVNQLLQVALRSDRVPVLKLDEGDLRLTPVDFANQVSQHLANALQGVSAADVARLVIVYSPSWAAECRLPADAQRIRISHRQIRDLLQLLYDRDTASQVRIIYGGFVFENEMVDVLRDINVDGVLINK